MTEYNIRVEGVEDGLTREALEYMVEDMFPHADSVEVIEAPE